MWKYQLTFVFFFFFSSRRRHTRYWRDWSSDVCSSDLRSLVAAAGDTNVFAFVDAVVERRGEEALRRLRSEERRGGEEGRFRWVADHLKKKNKRMNKLDDKEK